MIATSHGGKKTKILTLEMAHANIYSTRSTQVLRIYNRHESKLYRVENIHIN